MPKTAPKPQLTAVTPLNPWCWDLAACRGGGSGILLCLISSWGAIVGIPLILAAFARGVGGVVYSIIGAVKANNGESYVFPRWIAFRFVHTK